MDLPRFSWRRNAVLAIAMVSSLSLSVALASEPAYAEDLADTKSVDEALVVESIELSGVQNTDSVFSNEQPNNSSNETPDEQGGEPSSEETPGEQDGGQSDEETPGEQGGGQSDEETPGEQGGEFSGEEDSEDKDPSGEEGGESEPEIEDGWFEQDGKKYWYVDGAPVTNSTVVDPETGAKYWASEDGSIVTGQDVYVPRDPSTVDAEQWASSEEYRDANGKWIRLEDDGKMVLGEDYYNGHWYYFDPTTGEMMKNFTFHSGKWVYYDDIMGWMLYGEQYRPANKTDTQLHWYYFDEWTGATTYKWRYVSQGASGKWVYYDDYMGWMVYGEQYRPANNSDTQLHWYYFDEWTGATT